MIYLGKNNNNCDSNIASSKAILLFTALVGLLLNQSSVILDINFSLADLVAFFIVLWLVAHKEFLIPAKIFMFFFIISLVTLSTAVLYVPMRFRLSPSVSIVTNYIKLFAVFIYFLIGYNLQRLGLAERSVDWLSRGAIIISVIAIGGLFNTGIAKKTMIISGSRLQVESV